MNNYYGAATKISFEPVINLEAGDIVWVRWDHFRHGDQTPKATPSKVIKVYDDGNIIHEKRGYDGKKFAWADDVIAKSPGIPFNRMPYRTMSISDIQKQMKDLEVKELT